MPRPRPRPPFEDWPTQVYDPVFGFVWFAHPVVLVSQFTAERANVAAASFLQDHIDLVLERRAEEVAEQNGLFILHDFRAAASYETEARIAFVERMRKRPHGYMRRSVTCVRASPMLRMIVQAGNLAATLVSGGNTEMSHDPAQAMRTYGIEAPRVGERFPGK
jgi:hypothetical protein